MPLLQDILILLGFSVVIVFVLQRLKLPSIIGFLLTGVIIGPYGLSLIKAVEQVEILSEVGVILLLFVIGMELSIKQLASIRKTVFIGGFLQVGLTVLVAALVYNFLGNSWSESVFVGFLFSLSSTAIVLKTLQDRQEISTPQARNALAILIFQDIIVVPMMLVTPMMAGVSSNILMDILMLLVKSAIVVVLTYIMARYIVPKLMHAVAKTNSKELFLLVTITLCFAIAFLTAEIGLSLALGAFIAGLIISESEYSHQATSIILPFRELFTSFFFVSVGMLLDLNFFLKNVPIIMLLVLVVLILKSTVSAIAVALLKYPTKTAILTGLSLFQVGEFAFILSKIGIEYNLLTPQTNQYFLSVSIVSMILTPFIIIFSENIADKILGVKKKLGLKREVNPNDFGEATETELENHLVIIGYGINGSNLAKAATASNIPFIVIEMNAEVVKREKEKGLPIIFGDAREYHILETVNISRARAAVIAISEIAATRSIIKNIRSHSDSLYLVVRTRYVKETTELLALGADEVIPEEFETSIQIFEHVLHNFLVPEGDIIQLIQKVRSDNYQLFKGDFKRPKTIKPSELADFNITCLLMRSDSNKFLGKPLRDLNLRAEYGINILGIKRRDEMLQSVQPNEILKQGDKLYIMGNQGDVEQFYQMIK
ncbi:Kef-type potassium/proton antiporter (CPA2 family) [Winogradskyella epiphytica]|uniref:Kef-type potassium/proton antiporter (CPA2 family) n=1 Tax=Winogradskyella epiphytica TaxID=262005 RepID=A0A2V4XWK0_9FLAO|nr:monovalent cation:proton antiporter family protein [Winogradskyella epiphytica]PYE80004.1 Kef-type potassium/proton antiporter (CPA2 family) [Winogradskyella epiphytica]GGW73098.1 potassium transporter KefB [Winogradskyella epiphytica]